MLTVLQEQLGDAHGLAMAAAEVVDHVQERLPGRDLRRRLDELRHDANETRARCLEAEQAFGVELAAEILARANATAEKAADLAAAWFKAGTGLLEAWSFLAMGEAGEVAAWSALLSLAQRDGGGRVLELAEWALPVQRRHLELALEGVTLLAERAEPAAPRFG
jgi:GH24 family phage-related lysozyme (muramidase)